MKNSLVLIALAGSLAGSLLAGCEKASDGTMDKTNQTVADARQELKEARDNYRAEWQSFKRETEQVIEANGRAIDSLKSKIEKAGKKGKIAFTKDVEVLEQKNAELKKKLADYNDQGQSNWEVFKSDVKRELDGLGNAMRDLYKKIG